MRITEGMKRRFWAKVERRGADECWEWTATRSRGYGQLSTRKGKSPARAHRLSWMIHNGDIPADMCVCHRCNNRSCVNPKHLYLATQQKNTRDAKRDDRFKIPRPWLMGETNPNAKLSNKEAKEIRERFEKGESRAEIARRYGIDRTTVYRIANRQIRS